MVEKKKSTIKARMIQYADTKGFSKRKIYRDTGISNGTLNNDSGITEQIVDKFLQTYSDVDPVWLLTGKGNGPIRLTDPSLDDYSIVHERAALMGQQLSQSEIEKQALSTRSLRLKLAEEAIPLLSSIDIEGFIEDKNIIEYYVVPNFKRKGAEFIIQVDGDSMDPTFRAGDLVACKVIDEDSFIQSNKAYMIATEQGVLFNRIKTSQLEGFFEIHSDNKLYDNYLIERKSIKGIALIVGKLRPE